MPDAFKHMLVYAEIEAPPQTEEELRIWLYRLVKAVDMKVLIDPVVKYCNDPGNEGLTGMVGITTSHASIHVWEKSYPKFLQFDLFSCKEFEPDTVMRLFDDFKPYFADFSIIDRSVDEAGDVDYRAVREGKWIWMS